MKKLQIGNVTLDNPIIWHLWQAYPTCHFVCSAEKWEQHWCAWRW